jgi:hypothetical protein
MIRRGDKALNRLIPSEVVLRSGNPRIKPFDHCRKASTLWIVTKISRNNRENMETLLQLKTQRRIPNLSSNHLEAILLSRQPISMKMIVSQPGAGTNSQQAKLLNQ